MLPQVLERSGQVKNRKDTTAQGPHLNFSRKWTVPWGMLGQSISGYPCLFPRPPKIDQKSISGPPWAQKCAKDGPRAPSDLHVDGFGKIVDRFLDGFGMFFGWIWNDFDSKSATLNWAHQRKTYNPDSKIQYLEFKIQNPVPPFGLAGFAKRLQYVLHSAYYGIYIDTSRMHFVHPVPYQQVSEIAKPHTDFVFMWLPKVLGRSVRAKI